MAKKSDVVRAVKIHCKDLTSDEQRIVYLERVLSSAGVHKTKKDNASLYQYLCEVRMTALFDFNIREVDANCDKLPTPDDQKAYYSYVLKEAKLAGRTEVVDKLEAGLRHRKETAKIAAKRMKGMTETSRSPDVTTESRLRYGKEIAKPAAKPVKRIKESIGEPLKIVWLGTGRQLVDLFELLREKGLISKQTKHKQYAIIRDHFVDTDHQPYDNRKLAKNISNADGNSPIGHDTLQTIVTHIKDLK